MSRKILFPVFLVALAVCGLSAQTQTSSDEKQDLDMANHAILIHLAVMSAHPYMCTEQPTVCISANGIELGTALIAARNSPQSLRSFARLHRFILDASYGETYDELLCKKAPRIEKYVAVLNADELRRSCVKEFGAAVKANPEELAKAKVDDVCKSVTNIRSHLQQTLEMVRQPPASCEP